MSVAAASNFKVFVNSYRVPALAANADLQESVRQAEQSGGACGKRKAKWVFFQVLLDETIRLSEGADALAQALRQAVSDTAMRQKAAVLGETIRVEAGVRTAVALIQEYRNQPR